MQAITVKWLPATNTRGTRLKASCRRGSIIITASKLLDPSGMGDSHEAQACSLLCEKFIAEDMENARPHYQARGEEVTRSVSSWNCKWIQGQTVNGEHVFVSIPSSVAELMKFANLPPCNDYLFRQIGEVKARTFGNVITL